MARSSLWKYRNPVLLPDGRIDVEVKFVAPHHLSSEGWLPMTVAETDVDSSSIGPLVYALAKIDEKLKTKPLPTDQELYDEAAKEVRVERNRLLRASDWTQLPDVPETTRERWALYRQKLRDLPNSFGFPFKVKWPELPK